MNSSSVTKMSKDWCTKTWQRLIIIILRKIIHLPSHVTWSGVIVNVSSGLRAGFNPVNAGIKIVANAIDKPKSTINIFFAELANTFFSMKTKANYNTIDSIAKI